MNATQSPPLESKTLGRLVESLASVGVAGNEDDRRFEAQDLRASWDTLNARLREAGYAGGSLAMET